MKSRNFSKLKCENKAQPTKNDVVIKQNDLIRQMISFDLQELRLLAFCLASIDSHSESGAEKPMLAKVSDLVAIFPDMDKKSAFKVIKRVTNSINSKPLVMNENGKQKIRYWFLGVDYEEGEGTFTFLLSPAVMPYLIQLRKNFTKYSLESVQLFTSPNSWRIYELLKSYEYCGKWFVEIEKMKELLDLVGKYPRFNSFSERILSPSLNEINAKTDILVRIEKIKNGRYVTRLIFHISSKSGSIRPTTPPSQKVISGISLQDAIINILLGIGIHQKTAQEYVERIEKLDKLQIILEKLPGMIERSKGQAKYVLGAIQNEMIAKVNYQDRARKYKLAVECKKRKGTCQRRSLRDKSICDICHQVLP